MSLYTACNAGPRGREPIPRLEELRRSPIWGLLVHYRDGLQAMILKVGKDGTKWNFACRIAGDHRPLATSFQVGPWRNRNLFKALAHAIQVHFRTGSPPYPVERTLLTTGIVAAGVDSHFRGDAAVDTPQLGIVYEAKDYRMLRETGASWSVIIEKVDEPKGIDRLGKSAYSFLPEAIR